MLRRRVTVTGSLALEVVMVLALLSATVFGLVRTVFSPVALGSHVPSVVRDAGERVFGSAYFGEFPGVRAELAQTVRVTTSPELYFYIGGEEIPDGRGEFSGPYEARVNAYSPTGRRIAVVVAVGGTSASVLRAWAEHLVLNDPVIRPLVHEQLQITFLPLIAGLGILLLAEVFRRGALMRAELEGLV